MHYIPGTYPVPNFAVEGFRKSEISDISDVVPPSATIVWPIMYAASSEQRKTASFAIFRSF